MKDCPEDRLMCGMETQFISEPQGAGAVWTQAVEREDTRLDRAERSQHGNLCTMLKALNSSRRLQETTERC